MKRIMLIASIAAAFAGVSAAPVSAGFSENDQLCVNAPAANDEDNPGQGSGRENAPPGEERSRIPRNDGTERAEDHSPAIEECPCQIGG